MKRIEDWDVIARNNKIWSQLNWLNPTGLVHGISENPYPVMYIEGKPVWEGDELLYTDPNTGKQQIEKVLWHHRGAIASNASWVNNWSFEEGTN